MAGPSADGAEPAADLWDRGQSSGWRRWIQAGLPVPAGLAASIAAVAVAGSFLLGFAWRSQPAPQPTRSAPIASQGSATGGRPAAGAPTAEPPIPTRRLEYVRDVDWRPGS